MKKFPQHHGKIVHGVHRVKLAPLAAQLYDAVQPKLPVGVRVRGIQLHVESALAQPVEHGEGGAHNGLAAVVVAAAVSEQNELVLHNDVLAFL